MSKSVVVTGATGYLGRRLIRTLLREPGLRICCLIRESSNTEPLLAEIPQAERHRVCFATGSLQDEKFLAQHLQDADAVYHLAAALGGSASTIFLNTIVPTRSLIRAAALANVSRLVLVSSMGVYGPNSTSRSRILDESCPIDSRPELRDAYTFSKVRQETVTRELCAELELPLVIVRPGVIYGPGRSVVTSRVGLALGPILLRMGGRQQLPYVHVDNCADGIKAAGLIRGIDGESFNLVDDDLPTGRQILGLLRQHGKKRRSVWIPRMLIVPLAHLYTWYSRWSEEQLPSILHPHQAASIWNCCRYSNAKARHKLNWESKISTEEGLNQTIVS